MGFRFGARLTAEGAHVVVWSHNAAQIYLCLFDGDAERRLPMMRKGDVHEIFVSGLKDGQNYGLRAEGPWDEAAGHRFDSSKLLIDPYARELTKHASWHELLATRHADTASVMPKCVMRYDVPSAEPLKPAKPQLFYEVPVRAFTKLHPEVPEKLRGKLAALAQPAIISHLKSIGCDCVELMPIAAWSDERHLARGGLSNAWGYNTAAFMAPEPELAPGGLTEVRDTVAALHREGIRVVLDVVLNHTAESDFGGGTLSLRGLDNASYYRMDGATLINDTGCGNTLALDREPGLSLALDTLRHWVTSTGVDGFRYDLATVMGRTTSGFSSESPLLQAIRNDPLLSSLLHIAEPWDVGPGGYQLGQFWTDWHEWNDHFRDDVRRFWRGDPGAAGAFATRLAGSSDIFQKGMAKPSRSINFVAAHDGFAVGDVVRFDRKLNHANGENNRDGNDGEICWIDPHPNEKVKAMLASVMLARGIPMVTAGDEFGRSQNGNNNAYAQDNHSTWRNWESADTELISFTGALAKLRLAYAPHFADAFLTDQDASWFGADGRLLPSEEWAATNTVGLLLNAKGMKRLALVFSRDIEARLVQLPAPRGGLSWKMEEPCSRYFAAFSEE